MTRYSGLRPNPNILDVQKKSSGPKTEIGKLKIAVSNRKYSSPNAVQIDQGKKSPVTKMMEKAGVDFSIPAKAMEQRNLFEIWVKNHSNKELTEIRDRSKK